MLKDVSRTLLWNIYYKIFFNSYSDIYIAEITKYDMETVVYLMINNYDAPKHNFFLQIIMRHTALRRFYACLGQGEDGQFYFNYFSIKVYFTVISLYNSFWKHFNLVFKFHTSCTYPNLIRLPVCYADNLCCCHV